MSTTQDWIIEKQALEYHKHIHTAKKTAKNRYERRRVKNFIHLWLTKELLPEFAS